MAEDILDAIGGRVIANRAPQTGEPFRLYLSADKTRFVDQMSYPPSPPPPPAPPLPAPITEERVQQLIDTKAAELQGKIDAVDAKVK